MQPEKRMWLAVLLLAVAQQHPRYVRWLGLPAQQAKIKRSLITTEARWYVESRKFAEACERINIEPDRLRKLGPKRAFDAFQKLTSDDFDAIEVEKELDE